MTVIFILYYIFNAHRFLVCACFLLRRYLSLPNKQPLFDQGLSSYPSAVNRLGIFCVITFPFANTDLIE